MAIQTSPIFKGFRGSVNRHLLFRQCGGKTVFSKFPDRSKVIYSHLQKKAQKHFSDAVDFARVVISEPGLRDIYSIKASLLGFRSAWNVAIAEFMSDKPLGVKEKKIRFDKSIIRRSLGWKIKMNLYKYAEKSAQVVLGVPERLKLNPKRGSLSAARRLRDDYIPNLSADNGEIYLPAAGRCFSAISAVSNIAEGNPICIIQPNTQI